ncbi:hypothetical protein ACWC98_11600 [Streptomyces goshikiensis]
MAVFLASTGTENAEDFDFTDLAAVEWRGGPDCWTPRRGSAPWSAAAA